MAAEVLLNATLAAPRDRNRVFPAQEAIDYQLIIAPQQTEAAVRLPILVFPRRRALSEQQQAAGQEMLSDVIALNNNKR